MKRLTRDELDERLRLHKLWLDSDLSKGEKLCLTEVDLSGFELRGAILIGADIPEINFDDADLTGADLRRANVSSCTFRRAQLARVSLYKAKLHYVDATDADMTRADLVSMEWMHGSATRTKFDRSDLYDALFAKVDMSNCSLRFASLDLAVFSSVTLAGADPAGATGSVRGNHVSIGDESTEHISGDRFTHWLHDRGAQDVTTFVPSSPVGAEDA